MIKQVRHHRWCKEVLHRAGGKRKYPVGCREPCQRLRAGHAGRQHQGRERGKQFGNGAIHMVRHPEHRCKEPRRHGEQRQHADTRAVASGRRRAHPEHQQRVPRLAEQRPAV